MKMMRIITCTRTSTALKLCPKQEDADTVEVVLKDELSLSMEATVNTTLSSSPLPQHHHVHHHYQTFIMSITIIITSSSPQPSSQSYSPLTWIVRWSDFYVFRFVSKFSAFPTRGRWSLSASFHFQLFTGPTLFLPCDDDFRFPTNQF